MPVAERARRSSLMPCTASLLAVVASLGLAGCGDSDETGSAADATTPGCPGATAPAIELTGPMAAFDLSGLADAIGQSEDNGYFVVDAVANSEVSDLVIKFVDIVQGAGFDLAGSEDEGFEGEVFFASGDVAAGQVVLSEGDCDGVVNITIKLLDDPAVLPSSPSEEPT